MQHALWTSDKRFCVVPAGRRSGKTEIAKRKLVLSALQCKHADGRFVASAPTHQQAREIYWNDLKALVPKWARVGEPRLTPVPQISLVNGAKIQVFGMDRPARIEGAPVDGIILDEYANMREEVWTNHVRPALSTIGRPGWAWFIGVPEGRNHYYELFMRAQDGEEYPEWGGYHWRSEDILPPEEVAAAKKDLDPATFEQEYGGSFVNFEGRAFYTFDRDIHCDKVTYQPSLPLSFSLDFNISPGVALIAQEQFTTKEQREEFYARTNRSLAAKVTAFIGEIWIERDSNSHIIAKKLVEEWGQHKGFVHLYGDATGGIKHSQSRGASDWDQILEVLKPHFEGRVKIKYPINKQNPPVRATLNSVNARLMTVDNVVHTLINPKMCPNTIMSLEGCTRDSEGNLVKPENDRVTHLGDTVRYYIHTVAPFGGIKAGFNEY